MADELDDAQARQLETYRQLKAAQSSIIDAIGCARKGLLLNPSTEEERELNQSILDWAEKSEILEARILAVRNAGAGDTIKPPTAAQVTAIGSLSAEVEGLTNDNLTAAAALSLATKAMKLAGELTA